jgi:hypothetical protein
VPRLEAKKGPNLGVSSSLKASPDCVGEAAPLGTIPRCAVPAGVERVSFRSRALTGRLLKLSAIRIINNSKKHEFLIQ